MIDQQSQARRELSAWLEDVERLGRVKRITLTREQYVAIGGDPDDFKNPVIASLMEHGSLLTLWGIPLRVRQEVQ